MDMDAASCDFFSYVSFIYSNGKYKKGTLKYIKKNVPLNDFCKPEQIKDLCDYLLSNSGDFITGSNFIIDGGQVVNG